VTDDQIVSGHEHEKGKYVTIEPEELDRLRTPADKMVSIDAFVSPDTIDPIYLSGKVYYLVPEGAVGGHPFNLRRPIGRQCRDSWAGAMRQRWPTGSKMPCYRPGR